MMIDDTFDSNAAGVNLDIELSVCQHKKCYSFELAGQLIEVPIGWGIFKSSQNKDLHVDQFEDKQLIDVLSSLYGQKIVSIRFEYIEASPLWDLGTSQAA